MYRRVEKIEEDFEDTVVQYKEQEGGTTVGKENRINETKIGEE